jgi:hypothetical protein
MEEQQSLFTTKNLLIAGGGLLGVLLLLVVILGAVKNNSGKNGNNQTNPTGTTSQNSGGNQTGSTKVVAKFGNKDITESDVKQEAMKQFSESAIDQKTLDTVLDVMKERIVLDSEAAKLGITVDQADIDAMAAGQFPGKKTADIDKVFLEQIKYTLLKRKIMQKVVATRTAYVLGFWIPPLNSPDPFTDDEKKFQQRQRDDGKKALDEVLTKFQAGEVPSDVIQYVYQKYPALRLIVALNGYRYSGTSDKSVYNQPKVYEYDTSNGQVPFYDKLFSMKDGEVAKIEDDDGPGSGGSVIKVVSVSNGGAKTYKEWLNSKMKEYSN